MLIRQVVWKPNNLWPVVSAFMLIVVFRRHPIKISDTLKMEVSDLGYAVLVGVMLLLSLTRNINAKWTRKIIPACNTILYALYSWIITMVALEILKFWELATHVSFEIYLAFWAGMLAILHLWDLRKTEIEIKETQSSIQEAIDHLKQLRNQISFVQYTTEAYNAMAKARTRILSCVRKWTIDTKWLKANSNNLGLSVRRRRISTETPIPENLEKYLHSSHLAQAMGNPNDRALTRIFLGRTDYITSEDLKYLPGAIWRATFVSAWNSRFEAAGNPCRLESIAADIGLHFIIVDDNIFMATSLIGQESDSGDEFGANLGEDRDAAQMLATLYEACSRGSEPSHRAIKNIIRMAMEERRIDISVPLVKDHILMIVNFLYQGYPPDDPRSQALSWLKEGPFKGIAASEAELTDIIGGLMLDFILYATPEDSFAVDNSLIED